MIDEKKLIAALEKEREYWGNLSHPYAFELMCAYSDFIDLVNEQPKVAERDSIDGWPCCIICGSPEGLPEAHYIPRSRGGLGIEQNIVTLCRHCHRLYDQGTAEQRETIGEMIKGYLKSQYINWNEKDLIYRK